ncbi:3'(2'),5'-bisphosphate nucleotidase CysQ [Hahella sp. HN01]|uniref:3'(2'),5'-bisphosphate nucleotidase CysQ n=1 Tax=Hahella sp. HN01 TaxID=2847262 RepID=UPI001C1F052E|nr:3'(2'),5'-bisphosphate nucleotidase CysQ [Hahella sp. HN01]MBU6954145.1 3'(2'),5'-bisphosphate nucleotidase CysQ [Hahella sp. HN01]
MIDKNTIERMHAEIQGIMDAAGAAILDVYEKAESIEITTKDDDSPLTQADRRAHAIIAEGLRKMPEGFPVLSEESTLPDYEERRQWTTYWLVDPLDGTKEFINRNGEFTVNIALIHEGFPVAGWVYVPVRSQLYYGWSLDGDAAAFLAENGASHAIAARKLNPEAEVVVVASRRHGGEALQPMLDKAEARFAKLERKSIGSSLKICLVAEGKADWYPRLAPTSEWDTAAAHAVLLGAGGVMVDAEYKPLRYNSKESILNPHFHAIADDGEVWKELVL